MTGPDAATTAAAWYEKGRTDERRRIRQLALEHHAMCGSVDDMHCYEPGDFADLLDGPDA